MSKEKPIVRIPSVNVLLQTEQAQKLLKEYSRELVVEAIRYATDKFRREKLDLTIGVRADTEELLDDAADYLRKKFRSSLRRTINATGTVIHTNLGRAKLSPVVQDALLQTAFSFSNLEYDVEKGSRGSRYQHLERILCDLTKAEAALVVNNNAAAVMLALDTVAKGKEVLASRGELVEIGGSFRIPEIMELSGCILKEVGTTNKTHAHDYRKHISEETGAILKVHTSNYKICGFTESVSIEEMVNIAHEKDVPLIHDMGSGMLIDLEKYGFPHEMTVRESLEAGADIVTFSGDKVLGGPQAGIIVGKKEYIDAMKRNQLTRALRVDKMTIATLEATLRLYYDEKEALNHIPALRMLTTNLDTLEKKADKLAELLAVFQSKATIEVADTYSQVGGGAYPGEEIKSKAVTIFPHQQSVNYFSEALRKSHIPIIAKIRNEKCEFDVRTIDESEFPIVVEILEDVFSEN